MCEVGGRRAFLKYHRYELHNMLSSYYTHTHMPPPAPFPLKHTDAPTSTNIARCLLILSRLLKELGAYSWRALISNTWWNGSPYILPRLSTRPSIVYQIYTITATKHKHQGKHAQSTNGHNHERNIHNVLYIGIYSSPSIKLRFYT